MNLEPIVGIPRILQLSDGIMASGQLAPAHGWTLVSKIDSIVTLLSNL